jgi:hypothetical protein
MEARKMFPVRQRGQRWRKMSPTVASFVAVPIVAHHFISRDF